MGFWVKVYQNLIQFRILILRHYLNVNLIFRRTALTDEGALEIAESVKKFSGVTSAILGLG